MRCLRATQEPGWEKEELEAGDNDDSRANFNNLHCVRYTARQTNNAEKRFCKCGPFRVCNDQRVSVNGCLCDGRTHLKLVDHLSGNIVQANTPCPNTTCSLLYYRHSGDCRSFVVHEGCMGDSSCSAQVVVRVEGLDTISDDYIRTNFTKVDHVVRSLSGKYGLVDQCSYDGSYAFSIPATTFLLIIILVGACIVAVCLRCCYIFEVPLLCKDLGESFLTTVRGDTYEVADRGRHDSVDDTTEPAGDDNDSLRVQHIRLRMISDEDTESSAHIGDAGSEVYSDGTGVEDDTASLTSVSDIESDLGSNDWSTQPTGRFASHAIAETQMHLELTV